MTLKRNGCLSRRELVKALSLCAAGSATLPTVLSGCRQSQLGPERLEQLGRRREQLGGKPNYLIVVAAAGGASIIDSLLAVRASESANAPVLNTFPDAQVQSVAGSPLRAVKVDAASLGPLPFAVHTDQLAFVQKHKDDLLVGASVVSSVNHDIAQKRSITGDSAWKGRTLQECVALQWGDQFPLPNVNMASGGYGERGTDGALPGYCYGEVVQSTSTWPLGLDGKKGILTAPPDDVVALARATRNSLDAQSVFGRTFERSAALDRWNEQRVIGQPRLEAMDLITRLNILPDMPPQFPLSQYGLRTSADAARLRSAFPEYLTDPVQGQAALAFLLLKYRVSCTATLGPDFNVVLGGSTGLVNPPLAFDFSHLEHRAGQAFMWDRIFSHVDKLVELLKAEHYDATSGESMWDHTLIYVATEFGRSRNRPANSTSFGSGHHINNGFLIVSPLVKGNTILGGVDPDTAITQGFDARTGAAMPGKQGPNERDIFSGVLTALGVDTSGSGLPDASAFKA